MDYSTTTSLITSSLCMLIIISRYRAKSSSSSSPRTKHVHVNDIIPLRSCELVLPNRQPIPLTLQLPPIALEPLFSGTAWAGTIVWDAAIMLCQYVVDHPVLIKNKDVVELGAGIGCPGFTCAVEGARNVTITERGCLVELLTKNVAAISQMTGITQAHIEAREIDWLDKSDLSSLSCDVILVSDCIYQPLYGESWRDLAHVLSVLMSNQQHRPVICLNSCERRKDDGIDEFLHYLRREFAIDSELVLRSHTTSAILELYCHRQTTPPFNDVTSKCQ